MKIMQALENLAFSDQGPFAQQLHMDELGKIVRYTLKPGQELEETHAPFIPRNFIVFKGTGSFKSATGEQQQCGPGTVIVFERKEENIIQALDEEVVEIGFLYWAVGG